MALQVATTYLAPDITVVLVSDSLTFEATGDFLSSIQKLLDGGTKKLILDLSAVERIDRVGCASLIHSFFAAREAAASLCIAGASVPVKQLFRGTRVDTLIPFFATTAVACDHFGAEK